jgi:hypothetical protein
VGGKGGGRGNGGEMTQTLYAHMNKKIKKERKKEKYLLQCIYFALLSKAS